MTGNVLSTIADSAESRRQIALMALVLAGVWIVGALPAVFADPKTTQPFQLGHRSGFVMVQLVTYSWLHTSFTAVLSDLIWIAGIAHLASTRIAADGFLRLYSVGVVGGGLIYLGALLVLSPGAEGALAGASIARATMLAALFRPGDHSTEFLPPAATRTRARWIWPLCGAYVALRIFDQWLLLSRAVTNIPQSALWEIALQTVLAPPFLSLLPIVALAVVLMRPMSIAGMLACLMAPNVVSVLWLLTIPSARRSPGPWVSLVAVFIGVIVGMLYGVAERIFQQHSAPTASAGG